MIDKTTVYIILKRKEYNDRHIDKPKRKIQNDRHNNNIYVSSEEKGI